jgi:hypothetical protein
MEREMKKKLMLLAVVLKYKKKGQGKQHASATSSSNTIMEGNHVSDKSPCPIHPHSKHTWGECNANRYKSKASGSNNHLQSHNKASAGPSAHVAQLSETASASDEDVYCNNLRMDLTNGSDHQSHTNDCICGYTDSRVLTACKVQQHSHVRSSHFTAMFSSIHRLIWHPLMRLYTALEQRL